MSDPIQPKPRNGNPTLEDIKHSIEDTGISSETKIDQLLATAVTVRQELHDRTKRIVTGMCAVGAVFLLALGAAGGILIGLSNQADDLEAIAVSNGNNGNDIKTALDILLGATGPEARTRSAIATADVIRRNVIEGDCRMRRVQARLVAPDPSASCESQTDSSIYPGVAGEPPRS